PVARGGGWTAGDQRRWAADSGGRVAQAGEDLLATVIEVIGAQASALQIDGAVADLDDVAGIHRHCSGQVEVAVEDVAQQPGGVGGSSSAEPGQIPIDIPVEGQRVDAVGGAYVSRDQVASGDRHIEIRVVDLVQVARGKSRRT